MFWKFTSNFIQSWVILNIQRMLPLLEDWFPERGSFLIGLAPSQTVDRQKACEEDRSLWELEVCMSVTCRLVFVSPVPRWSLLDYKAVCLLLYWDESMFLVPIFLVMHSFWTSDFFVFFLSFHLQIQIYKKLDLYCMFWVFAWNKRVFIMFGGLDPLKLELGVFMNGCVGAGHWTWLPWKSNQCQLLC